MLWRYEEKPDADISVFDRFSDSASIHDRDNFPEAMAWAVEAGILEGDSGNLKPLEILPRWRGAAILHRYCEKILGE